MVGYGGAQKERWERIGKGNWREGKVGVEKAGKKEEHNIEEWKGLEVQKREGKDSGGGGKEGKGRV